MSRLVYAVAASAVLGLQGVCGAAWAAEPRAGVEGSLDPSLKALVVQAIGEADRPIQNRFEARRRAHDAADDATAALRSEGYYAAQVDPDIGEGDAPAAVVRIVPGHRFKLADPQISWVGQQPDPASVQATVTALGLKVGAPGRAEDVVDAEGRAIATMQKRGYADAKPEPREVIVDHADASVRPTFRLNAGQVTHLDGILLTTDGRTDPAWVQRFAGWRSGQTYDPASLAELERRLRDTGVYDSVTVALAPEEQATADGLRPVVVTVAERKRRTLEVGASYGTTEGPGVDVRWTRYNVLGRTDTFAWVGRLSNLDSKIEADVTLPDWRRPREALKLSAGVYRELTSAYDETRVGIQADLERRFTRTSYFTYGASIDFSRTDALRLGTLTPLGSDVVTFGTLADLALDRSDDPLNPKHGWRVSVRAQPTLLTGIGTVPYLRLQTQGTGYLPIGPDAHTVLAGRLRLGSILNAGVADIPASQRFFSGGGGSVRGFGYQDVGPRLSDNTPQGGISLFEASAEVRHDLTERWSMAAFVDAGAVTGDPNPAFKNMSVGAGLGVRYNMGFGPIRVDLATPIANRHGAAPFQIYVSIGQSF